MVLKPADNMPSPKRLEFISLRAGNAPPDSNTNSTYTLVFALKYCFECSDIDSSFTIFRVIFTEEIRLRAYGAATKNNAA